MGFGCLALALLLAAPRGSAMEPRARPAAASEVMAQIAPELAIAEYRRLLTRYLEARAAFEQEAGAYWNAISEKRRGRNAKRRDHQAIALDDYVLTQPPVYSGPKRPVNPAPEPEPEHPPREHKAIPVVADLLKAAAEQFRFAPQRPSSEIEFKRAYAQVASAAGLTREQAVRDLIRFETGGTAITMCNPASSTAASAPSPPRSVTTSCSPPTPSSSWPSRDPNSSGR